MGNLSHDIEENISILQSVINSALDAVIVIDEGGVITEWNHQAEHIFGWNRDEVLGKLLSDKIIPSEDKSPLDKSIELFLASGDKLDRSKRRKIEVINEAGVKFPIELTTSPNKVNEKYFFSLFIRDLRETHKSVNLLKAINELALSLLGKTNLEEIAWVITQNTIELLGLEDCVIYILDHENNTLHQIAAYGPKSPDGKHIENEISLMVGQGIVGRAAATKRPVLVNDTSLDAAYVLDDHFRYSELAVPILYEGEVIGVIDTEHQQKNFYTKEHLYAFTTIANLTSSKINSAIQALKRQEVEKSLTESEERWQNLVENMPEALQISKNGKVLYMNPAGLKP